MSISIKVPPLVGSDGIVIVPGVIFGDQIEHFGIKPRSPEVLGYRQDVSTKPYTKLTLSAPTLAQLRHAYFDKGPYDQPLCPNYRQNVLVNSGVGELTTTFLIDENTIVERPKGIIYKNGVGWNPIDGSRIRVELPPHGWIVEFDPITGLPSRTSERRGDAEKVFGDDASYWFYPSYTSYSDEKNLRPLYRLNSTNEISGPFCILTRENPSEAYKSTGFRVSKKLE